MLLSELLITHARGDLDRQAEHAIREVAEAVNDLDKVGVVTLKLKFDKTGGRIMVAGTVESKIPLPPAEAGLYFVGDDGLQKDDPKQFAFEGMKGLMDDAPPKAVDPETGEVHG